MSEDGALPMGQPTDRGSPVIRTIAMPADTNPAGDIFGGWLMAKMDLATGAGPLRHHFGGGDDLPPPGLRR